MIQNTIALTNFKIEKKPTLWKVLGNEVKNYYIINNLKKNTPPIENRFYVYKRLVNQEDWNKLEKGEFATAKKLNLEYTRQKPKHGSFISNRIRKIN